MRNTDIRNKIKRYRLKQWEVAERLNVCEATFNRWLRYELDRGRKEKIMKAIEDLNRNETGV